MNVYLLAAVVLFQMIIFSIGQFPIIIAFYFNRMNLLTDDRKQKSNRMITISIILTIISMYNIMSSVLDSSVFEGKTAGYIALFFSIVIIVLVCLSIYSIIEHLLLDYNGKHRHLFMNATVGILIIAIISSIFLTIVTSQEKNIYYLDLTANLVYPTLLLILGIAGIISLFFYKSIKRSTKKYIFTILTIIPFYIIDICLLRDVSVQTVSIPFLVFITIMSNEFLKSVIGKSDNGKPETTFLEFIDKYDITERESEVLALAAKGIANKEISQRLFVSVHTVKSHMQRLFSKLNIRTRYELMNMMKDVDVSDLEK